MKTKRERAIARLARLRRRELERRSNDLLGAALLGSFVAGVVAHYVDKANRKKPKRPRLRLVKGGRA